MKKIQKLYLDGAGIVANIIAIIQFFIDGQYVVSALLAVTLVGLVAYGIFLLLSKPYKVLSVSWKYLFCDAQAQRVEVTKTTILVPKERNVTSFQDKGIPASGDIKDVSSINGIVAVCEEGGATTVYTTFDTPLKVDEEYAHSIDYVGENCFPKDRESILHTTIHRMDKAEIGLNFHAERRPSNVKASKKVGSKSRDITNELLEVDDLCFTLKDAKPRRGTVYSISWNW